MRSSRNNYGSSCWNTLYIPVIFSFQKMLRFPNIVGRAGTNALKRLYKQELPSGPVSLSFHGLNSLSLYLLKTAGT